MDVFIRVPEQGLNQWIKYLQRIKFCKLYLFLRTAFLPDSGIIDWSISLLLWTHKESPHTESDIKCLRKSLYSISTPINWLHSLNPCSGYFCMYYLIKSSWHMCVELIHSFIQLFCLSWLNTTRVPMQGGGSRDHSSLSKEITLLTGRETSKNCISKQQDNTLQGRKRRILQKQTGITLMSDSGRSRAAKEGLLSWVMRNEKWLLAR